MIVLGIDPGPQASAFAVWDSARRIVFGRGKPRNEDLRSYLCTGPEVDVIVIERVASFGMPVGDEIFETVYWSGVFTQAAESRGRYVTRITRKAVVVHLCGTPRAKDPNVRRVILDRFGGDSAARKNGPLSGIAGDVWQALGVAIAYAEGAR